MRAGSSSCSVPRAIVDRNAFSAPSTSSAPSSRGCLQQPPPARPRSGVRPPHRLRRHDVRRPLHRPRPARRRGDARRSPLNQRTARPCVPGQGSHNHRRRTSRNAGLGQLLRLPQRVSALPTWPCVSPPPRHRGSGLGQEPPHGTPPIARAQGARGSLRGRVRRLLRGRVH